MAKKIKKKSVKTSSKSTYNKKTKDSGIKSVREKMIGQHIGY